MVTLTAACLVALPDRTFDEHRAISVRIRDGFRAGEASVRRAERRCRRHAPGLAGSF